MLETYINSTLTILTYLSYLGTVKCKGAGTPIVTRFRRPVGQLLRQVRRLDVGHCSSRSITDSDDTVLHVRYCYRLSATLQVIHNYMVQYPPPKKTKHSMHHTTVFKAKFRIRKFTVHSERGSSIEAFPVKSHTTS